jgi:hypothetical protein
MVTHRGGVPEVDACKRWLLALAERGVRIGIPEIADYEVRRELLRAGKMRGIERLDLRLKVDTEKDERDALVQRTADERVDRTVVSAEQAKAAFANLARLRAAGLYRGSLAYHDLGALRVTMAWEHESKPATETVATLEPNGSPAPFPDITKYTAADVQWDTPIPPPEAYGILAKMSSFKEATVYKVGESYLGKDVWAMDLMPPIAASHWSQAKQTTMKPTIVYSARQHANEVSSTSHILKLAELIVTDSAYRSILKRVNIVLHPVENPDGAQMAFDLAKLTPTHMLHAGRYSALGQDVGNGAASGLLPESLVRGKIWREWLPDIYLNPHGYPSHEWVEQFSGYVPPQFRIYWSSRGWYTTIGGVRDPRYPEMAQATDALRDAIAREINSNNDVHNMDVTTQARYRRWGYGFGPFVYGQEIYKDTAIYYSDLETGEPRGSSPTGRFPGASPADEGLPFGGLGLGARE